MAGVITYDSITVQQGQCLMDIALQYYGTADPQALIALIQDNLLENVTAEVKAGDILKIRKNAEFANKKIVDYYNINNIIPATASTNNVNLIADASIYNGTWTDPYLSFQGDYMIIDIFLTLRRIITINETPTLLLNSNVPFQSFALIYGSNYWEFDNFPIPNVDNYITLLPSTIDYNEIMITAYYAYVGINYNIKMILQ